MRENNLKVILQQIFCIFPKNGCKIAKQVQENNN